jgi:hypothetical protein
LKTFTLYFRKTGRDEDAPSFEPLLCATEVEALTAARRRLAARPEYDRVEVCFGDQHLFNIGRPQA